MQEITQTVQNCTIYCTVWKNEADALSQSECRISVQNQQCKSLTGRILYNRSQTYLYGARNYTKQSKGKLTEVWINFNATDWVTVSELDIGPMINECFFGLL